jgi:hypothetical protein
LWPADCCSGWAPFCAGSEASPSALEPDLGHSSGGILEGRLELVAGIAMMLSDLITAVVCWAVAKVRRYDLFDQVIREAEQAQDSPT